MGGTAERALPSSAVVGRRSTGDPPQADYRSVGRATQFARLSLHVRSDPPRLGGTVELVRAQPWLDVAPRLASLRDVNCATP